MVLGVLLHYHPMISADLPRASGRYEWLVMPDVSEGRRDDSSDSSCASSMDMFPTHLLSTLDALMANFGLRCGSGLCPTVTTMLIHFVVSCLMLSPPVVSKEAGAKCGAQGCEVGATQCETWWNMSNMLLTACDCNKPVSVLQRQELDP